MEKKQTTVLVEGETKDFINKITLKISNGTATIQEVKMLACYLTSIVKYHDKFMT